MRNVLRTLVGSLAVALLVAPAVSASTTTTAPENVTCAEAVVADWSLKQLANETIVVPVDATSIQSMMPAARAGYGGLLLFGTSAPPSIATLLARIQASTPHRYSMMIMTDEEGGGVQRLTNVIGSIPWARTMGRNLSAARILAVGRHTGTALRAAGVNTDLAPVLDVDGRHVFPSASNPDGMRSFGGSPSVVAVDGTAFMNGLAQAHVTAVVKHFPGLGGSSSNTDYGPATTEPWSVLEKTGLVPFVAAINGGATAVMLSNASVPGLTTLPASISPAIVHELRNNLGFQGLIVTDSLSAGAISARHLSVPAAAVRSIRSGTDLLLYGSPSSASVSLSTARKISSALAGAVTNGTLARSTLTRAAAQVLATRNVLSCPTAAS